MNTDAMNKSDITSTGTGPLQHRKIVTLNKTPSNTQKLYGNGSIIKNITIINL